MTSTRQDKCGARLAKLARDRIYIYIYICKAANGAGHFIDCDSTIAINGDIHFSMCMHAGRELLRWRDSGDVVYSTATVIAMVFSDRINYTCCYSRDV